MSERNEAYLCLALHAHLPFVRHPEYQEFFEERWLFEAISETYLPLLRVFKRLEEDAIPFKVCLNVSPTLSAMLLDTMLQTRYKAYLAKQLELAEREEIRTKDMREFAETSRAYKELYEKDLHDFVEEWECNILRAFDFYAKRGRIELLTSAATHAFLPLYTEYPEAIGAQVETAVKAHSLAFGKHPDGFWLPELGYAPGLEASLKAYNLRYTILATHGVLFAEPKPVYGSYAPVSCGGVAMFPRDIAATKAVWSSETGYPADPDYRDFYRDIGYDLPLDDVGPYILEGGIRVPTGFKYYAITGKTNDKKPYSIERAKAKVQEHASHFLSERIAQAKAVAPIMDRPPLITAPYDAELFGHWWFEGPAWIEALFRELQARGEGISVIHPSEYLKLYPECQETRPEFSSWGTNGYAETWLDASNDWIYRHTYKAIERMIELTERFPNESGLKERALNQAAREVLLSQCSDWPFMMKNGSSASFARWRVEDHVNNFMSIYDSLSCNSINTEWLTRLEKRNNLFPFINYRMFMRKV